jgi:hypothetical protein
MIWRPLHQKISQVLIIASRLFSTTLVGEKRNTELLTLIKIVTIKIESFIANYFFTYGVHNSHFFYFYKRVGSLLYLQFYQQLLFRRGKKTWKKPGESLLIAN